MIINIRGTHGSGKSTVMRMMMEQFETKMVTGPSRKVLGYIVNTPGRETNIIGNYTNDCGGCDGIQPYADIWPRVVAANDVGYHVLFEGALVSNSYGNIGRDSEVYGDQFVFAFLTTPLKTCIDRIVARRAAKGNTKPFDPNKSVIRIYKSNESVKRKAIGFGRRVVELNYKDPLPQILELLASAHS